MLVLGDTLTDAIALDSGVTESPCEGDGDSDDDVIETRTSAKSESDHANGERLS